MLGLLIDRGLSRPAGATVAMSKDTSGEPILAFTGWLDARQSGRLWSRANALARGVAGSGMVLDLAALEGCDTVGATLIRTIADAPGVVLANARPSVSILLDLVASTGNQAPARRITRRSPDPRESSWAKLTGGVAFLGEAVSATIAAPFHLRTLRAGEIWRIADQAGVRAVPLVLLLGLLMGLILAFQSLIPLRRFGAELYVANLVGLSLTRELGPLLTAVILAGRTGSAFAAELGTMRVNEEIDAIRTFGLDPVTLLVLPRLAAAALVMPALTILLEVAGMAGMMIVLDGFGFPPVAVANQLARAVRLRDLWSGLFKAVIFGCVIAAIGCRAGLATGKGPRAVGLSATAAVVGGIVATIILDGGFALLFYRMGI